MPNAGAQSAGKEQETVQPTSEEVRTYLSRLLGRSEFDASARNRRFLSYVVEETLEGRADRIKAYNIALSAFDRTGDFDPLTDPIVRIEAGRLRRSLEHYYLTAGNADRIRIDIPKGSYAAAFTYHEDRSEARDQPPQATGDAVAGLPRRPISTKRWSWPTLVPTAAALVLLVAGVVAYTLVDHGQRSRSSGAGSRGPSVIVLPFEYTGGDPGLSFIARGLTFEIIGGLARFDDLFVFGSETSFTLAQPGIRLQLQQAIKPDYVLSGAVQASDTKVRVSAILADAGTGQYLWSSAAERDLTTTGLMQIQKEIADQVAAAIAQPYGFVFEQKAQEISAKPAESLVAYECVVRFRQYWRSYSDRDYDGIRTCLEQTVATDPFYARAYSSLALLYIDAYRFGFGRSQISFDPLERATELADKAIKLDPNSADGYLARAMTLWFFRDVQGSIQAARQGLERNPNNADLLAELGFRYAFLANWDEAMPLAAEAYARNPDAPSGYYITSFLYAYMHGDYKAALDAALKVETPNVLYGAVARAMAYAQMGDAVKASQQVAAILSIDPKYGEHVAEDLAKRSIDPAIKRAIMEGLAKAGLPVRMNASDG